MNFANLRKKAKEENDKIGLSKEECVIILNLIGESNIQVKNIQQVYDLVYKLQEYVQQEQK